MNHGRSNLRLSDIDLAVRDRLVRRILTEEPETSAILVRGSYARGTADHFSDLDLAALTTARPIGGHRTWFEPTQRGRLHVSISVREINQWLENIVPASWSLGFATHEVSLYLHEASGDVRKRLGDPPVTLRPSSPPELEDFIEYIMKMRRAASAGDGVSLRWYAHGAAELAPGLLIPLNPERRVGHPQDALIAALNLPVSPEMYREDMLVTLGLEASETSKVERSALRLAKNMLEFLKQHKPDIDSTLTGYLLDGSLERHLDY